jgi:rhodanese-related sulfurtransferase
MTMKKRSSFSLLAHLALILLLYTIYSTVQAGGLQEKNQALQRESSDGAPPKIKLVHPEVPRIPAKEVKEMLAKKADFVLVDTSPADYFELWHIPTAINISYITLADDPSKKESMLGKLPKDKLIVIYCLCEEGGDSSEVALMLRQMDYRRDKIKILEGGMIKWDEAGYPMIKTEVPE